jgi:8-oxo-dGTP pyrophosphatase MutT (NUDIX family)
MYNINIQIIDNDAFTFVSFGGKVEPGETTREGALRELEEEAGITVKSEDFNKAGILLFQFENDPVALETHVYKTYKYQGQIREYVKSPCPRHKCSSQGTLNERHEKLML